MRDTMNRARRTRLVGKRREAGFNQARPVGGKPLTHTLDRHTASTQAPTADDRSACPRAFAAQNDIRPHP
jgi:hypothetical protein